MPSCTELGAQGAALSVATALGLYPSLEGAVRHLVKITRGYEPDPTRHAAYQRKFARFAAIAAAMAAAESVSHAA
ncbi:hypothetical protein [Lichenifustis flavocetrariae]|uniref:Uncharacterized protein n=1 Tax=Lichenifustis flavocetrariae TaxID=2949735 RepID=A0AA41Z0M1_9HYPH|nr:hypothetical protein [Lichenifustis flavocetrariae]